MLNYVSSHIINKILDPGFNHIYHFMEYSVFNDYSVILAKYTVTLKLVQPTVLKRSQGLSFTSLKNSFHVPQNLEPKRCQQKN